MTAYSKAAKRRAHKEGGKRGLFAQEQARDDAMAPMNEPDDPQRTVREARARQTGKPQKEVLAPIYGFSAGRAIQAGARNKTEAAEIWRRYLDFDQADETYSRRVLGRSRFPNVSKMEVASDPFWIDPDEKPDLRSEDQKDKDAVNAWMRWQGYLGHLQGHERMAITQTARQITEPFKDGGLTTNGSAFIAAMRVLCDVVDKAEGRR